jgi:hypothetical protein
MSLLALLMWCVMTWSTIVECAWKPLDYGLDTKPQIQHTWYDPNDPRQLMVQRAYEIGGLDFVLMIECESWFNPQARWDSWRAYGLCQLNNRWHKVSDEYKNSWEIQIDTCYQKWISWTKFYWPNRIIKWVKCKDYVKSRFIFK